MNNDKFHIEKEQFKRLASLVGDSKSRGRNRPLGKYKDIARWVILVGTKMMRTMNQLYRCLIILQNE